MPKRGVEIVIKKKVITALGYNGECGDRVEVSLSVSGVIGPQTMTD